MDNPIQFFTNLLGQDVFFVPCEHGTKTPLITYVERPFEGTKTLAYQAIFASGQVNIAIYLGKASHGLCALDFDADADLETFMALNPALAKTTQSRGSRGGMVWFRVEGDYPPSCNPAHKRFEWRADDRLSTIYGRHPKGMDYQLVCEQPPVTVKFADLVWPTDWELPWVTALAQKRLEELEKKYGKLYYTAGKENKLVGINEHTWAGMFAAENDLLFDPEEKAFYLYHPENGRWVPVTPAFVREAVANRILEVSREIDLFALETWITARKMASILTWLEGVTEKRGAFRNKKPIIHVGNGVVRLEDGEIKFGGYSKEDYSRNQSPINFESNAQCPRFLGELIQPALSEEDADLIQRWAGLALFGYNLPQRFLILDGMPNGGKSTLVKIIQELVGTDNWYQLRTECLNERFEMFRYRGKTLLIGSDVPGEFLMEKGASKLKTLVGGDPLSVEGKGFNATFSMFGTFNLIITCNSRLRIRLDGDTGAWRRRLMVVRYEKPPVKKRILDFDKILLKEEGPGILNWALHGFIKLQSEFKSIGDFAFTQAQTDRIDSLLNESESLKCFVGERIEAFSGEDLTVGEIKEAYADYCAEKGWNVLPETVIERQLADLMLERFHVGKSKSIARRDGDKMKSQNGFRGVRLIEPPAGPQTIDPEDVPFV